MRCSTKSTVVIATLLKVFLYYLDAASDGAFAHEVYSNAGNTINATDATNATNATTSTTTLDAGAPPMGFFYAIVACILLHVVVVSIIDVATRSTGGLGWGGVLLNVTYTRILYSALAVFRSGSDEDARAAARANGDLKTLEAVLESMPQLYLQMTVLLLYRLGEGDWQTHAVLYGSLSISTLSVCWAVAGKLLQMLGRSDRVAAVGTAAYFAGDVISRSIAVAMVFGAQGKLLAAWGAAAFVLDFAVQVPENWRDETDGEWCYHDLGDGCSKMASNLPGRLLASALSLFCSLPLSTQKSDRLRTFLISTAMTASGVAVAATSGYGAVHPETPILAVVVGTAVIKVLAYVTVVHWLEPEGVGVAANAGVALFALSAAQGYGSVEEFAARYGVSLTDTTWNLGSKGITDADCPLIAQMLKLAPNLATLK